MPVSGEAETLQGELIRSIENLRDEAFRNGWINWDSGDEEAIEVLGRYLSDPAVFPLSVQEQIEEALDQVRYAGQKGADKGFFGYEEIQFLGERVAEWVRFNSELKYKHPEATWLDEDPFRCP